jgi:hypothetical protein
MLKDRKIKKNILKFFYDALESKHEGSGSVKTNKID